MSSPLPRRLAAFAAVLLLGILAGWIFLRTPASPPPAPGKPAAASKPIPAPRTEVEDASAQLQSALETARNLREPAQRTRTFGQLLQEWIARDPEAALAYVRSLGSGPEFTQGLLMVLPAIGRTDPERALGLARELVTTREQRAVYSALFAQMATSDPASAATRLALVPAGAGRENAVRALADGWSRADPAAALAWARNLSAEERPAAMESVLASMQGTDPLQAAELALQTLNGAALERTLVASVQALARTDLAAAAALVGKFPEGDMQNQAMFPVARGLAAKDPMEAVAWMKTLPAGLAQDLALHNILDVWTAQAPVAAGQFVTQMSPGPAQVAAAGYLAGLLAGNPPAAIQWAQTLPNEESRNRAWVNLASGWARTDPAAAASWAASLTATPEVRTQALQAALSYWLERDSAATRNFIAGLPAASQAAAAAHVAPGLAQRDPVSAIAWTQTLPAEARDVALAAAYSRWVQNAPAAAKAWLVSANLPADAKARLGAGP